MNQIAELLAHEGDSPTELAMQAAIRDLVSRVEASQLTWTDAKPTVPGWYWWRDEVDATAEDWQVVWIYARVYRPNRGELSVSPNDGGGDLLSRFPGQFAGPIPLPADITSAAPSPAAEG